MDNDIDYIGKNALKRIKQKGIKRKQIGLEIDCSPLKGPNTTFWPIEVNGKRIGKITSAIYSPRLKKNIALAIIDIDYANFDNKFKVITNQGKFNCKMVEKPFYDPKKKIVSKL